MIRSGEPSNKRVLSSCTRSTIAIFSEAHRRNTATSTLNRQLLLTQMVNYPVVADNSDAIAKCRSLFKPFTASKFAAATVIRKFKIFAQETREISPPEHL